MHPLPHHRHAERAELKALLLTGVSVLMLAPRRIGKTWLLEKIHEDMEAAGWLCVRIDVEGMQKEEQFLEALCAEIEEAQDLKGKVLAHFTHRLKQLSKDFSGDTITQAIGKIDPRDFIETLVASLDAQPKKTVILIDEIALFVAERTRVDVDGARALLYHLRRLQQEYKNVVWFLTGSVGLDVVARRHEMQGAVLGYDTFPLAPFTEDAARSYLAELSDKQLISRPFEFGEGAFEYLARELGWLSPYYLRQIALLVRPVGGAKAANGRPIASPDDIESAISTLLSPTYRVHFAAWEEHIRKNFSPDETRRLRAILDIACESSEGEVEATYLARLGTADAALTPRMLKDLLFNLANDGFLQRSGDRWRFQSGLLRRFWIEYIKA